MLDVLKTLIDGILEKAKTFKGDWNENDAASPNYIKNRTHWTEKKEKIIYVFNNYSFESTSTDGLYGIDVEYNCETDPKINQTYTVIFDGEEYKCKCIGNEFSMDEGTTSEELIPCIIGNLGIIGAGADTGEPFMILFQKADNGINFITNTIGLHTISIYKNDIVEKIHKLDKKYLPEIGVGRVSTGLHAEIFNDYNYNGADGEYSHAEGQGTTANGNVSHAEGYYTKAMGLYSHAEGYSTTVTYSGEAAHTEGSYSEASGKASHAEGQTTEASGDYSHTEGENTKASGKASHAEGSYTEVSGDYSHTEGENTKASGEASHAEGSHTKAFGSYSHAEGINTSASMFSIAAHAEGDSTVATGDASHAEGYNTIALGDNSHVQGKYNIQDSLKYAHIVGNGNNQIRSNAHTLDWNGNAWFSGDIYVGSTSGIDKDEGSKKLATEEFVSEALVNADWNQNDETAKDYIKNRTHWVGEGIVDYIKEEQYHFSDTGFVGVQTKEKRRLVEGITYTVIFNGVEYTCTPWSKDNLVFALGNEACIPGKASMENPAGNDEPFCIYVFDHDDRFDWPYVSLKSYMNYFDLQVSGIGTVVHPIDEKYLTAVAGRNVTGKTFEVNGESFVAEEGAEVFNNYDYNIAIGINSHAEGAATLALGINSHAEGQRTEALGQASHAKGLGTVASGYVSYAEGRSTEAIGDYSHVQGKYNVTDTTSAFIIGNGTSTSNRSNAHTLDWNGNAWFSGDIYVGSTSGTNKDGGSKKLATENYVTENYYTKAEVEALIAQAITAAIAASY